MANEISDVPQQLNEDGEHLASDLGEGNPAGVNLDLNTFYKNIFSTPANSVEDHDFRRYFKDPFSDDPFQLATSPTYGGAGSDFDRYYKGVFNEDPSHVTTSFVTFPANGITDNAEGPPPHQLFDTSATGNSQLRINSILANTNDEITYNIEGPPPANTNEEQMEEVFGSNPPEQLIRMEKPPAEFDIREHIVSQDLDPSFREALERDLGESLPVLRLALDVFNDFYEKGIRPQDLDFLRLISYSFSMTVNRIQGHYNKLNRRISPLEMLFEGFLIISDGLKKINIREKEVHPSTPEQLSVTSGAKQSGLYISFEEIKKPLQGRDLPSASDCMGPSQLLKTYGMNPSPQRTTYSDGSRVYRMIYDTDELEDLKIYLKDCKSMFACDEDMIPCPATLMPLKDFTPRFTAVDEPFYSSLTYRPTAITMSKIGWLAVLQYEISLDVCSNGKPSINKANSHHIIIAEMKLRIPRDISLPQKRRRAKTDFPLETLLKHCNKTLKQAAHDIGVSESKLKDVVKEHGYGGWKDFTIKSKNSPKLVLLEAANAQPSVASSSFMQVDGGSQHRMQTISSSATETNSKPVMVTYGKSTYEFDLTSDSKIEDLEKEVTEREKDLPVGSFYVEYKNRAGVWIRIACYEDLKRCLDSFTSSAVYAAEMQVKKKRQRQLKTSALKENTRISEVTLLNHVSDKDSNLGHIRVEDTVPLPELKHLKKSMRKNPSGETPFIYHEHVPKQYERLYKYAKTTMAPSDASIHMPLDDGIFGAISKNFYILSEDIVALLEYQQITAPIISAYMNHLYKVIAEKGESELCAFIDPGETYNFTRPDFVSYMLDRLTRSTSDRTVYFLPHNPGLHWILSIIYAGELYILDPLPRLTRYETWENALINVLKAFKEELNIPTENLEVKHLEGVPKQPGGWECGYYVMRYMRDIVHDDNTLEFLTKWKTKSKSYGSEALDEVRFEVADFIQSLV